MILNKKKTVDALCDAEDMILESVGCDSSADCDACQHQQLCYFITDLRDEIYFSGTNFN